MRLLPFLAVAALSASSVLAQPTAPQALHDWARGVPATPSGVPQLALSGHVLADGHTLSLRLTNVSAQPIIADPFRLPWGNPNALNMFGLTHRGQVLTQTLPIADPGFETPLVIAPGQSLTGSLDLSFKLNGFSKARAAGPVIVVWSYELKAGQPVITGAAVAGR